jgi:very-short-patch-repair endonuclease
VAANRALLALLARQDGLVTAAQAARCGLSERSLQRRAHGDGWKRVAPRVFLAAGQRLTDRGRVRAAGLWAGDRGAISGPAAAWWHRMPAVVPAQIEVTVPRRLGLRGHRGARIRRRDLSPADVVLRNGIRCTAAPLTVLETAIVVPGGSAFLDRALQRHVRFEEVYEAYCRNVGARGGARAAGLLIGAADRADSAAERLLISLLRAAGITGWARGRPFERWTIDIAFPEAELAIEVDSWAWHVDVDRFQADRRKGNALVRAGWQLLRFTWHDLTNRPARVIAEIRAALRAAATA